MTMDAALTDEERFASNGGFIFARSISQALTAGENGANLRRIWDVLCSEDCSIGFQPVFCSYRDVFKRICIHG